jgi:hypothetical protein
MKNTPNQTSSRWLRKVVLNFPAILSLAGLIGLSFSLLNYLPRTSVTSGRLLLHILSPAAAALLGWLLTVPPLRKTWSALTRKFQGDQTLPYLKTANYFALYLTIFSAFIAVKIVLAGLDFIRIYNDTATYAAFAAKPLGDLAFWAGRVPFTYPLIFKFLGLSSFVAGEFFQTSNPLSDFQVVFSIISWGLLAFSFTLLLKRRWIKLVALGVILFFSAAMDISLWDRILLSESLTHSLFALLVALWIFGALMIQRRPHFLISALYLIALTIVTILFSFMRDTNSYLLLAAAFFMALGLLIKGIRRNPLIAGYSAYILLILLVFFMENKSSDLGRRWQTPFLNVLIERVYQQPDMLNYFVQNGMPQKEALLAAQRSMPSAQYHDLVSYDARFAPLQTWSETKGKNILIHYLLSKPFASITAPLINYELLLNGVNEEYRQPRQPDPPWVAQFSGLLYTHNPMLLFASVVLLLVTILVWWRQKFANPYVVIPAALMLFCYPLMFMVWHGDAGEIERHSALIGICFRLSAWMMVFWLLDNIKLGVEPEKMPKS